MMRGVYADCRDDQMSTVEIPGADQPPVKRFEFIESLYRPDNHLLRDIYENIRNHA